MYKLEFSLKQHTPLIHFQHDQEGATLRATEVKPKLDQFILEKLLIEENISFNYFDQKQNFIDSRKAFKLETEEPKTEIQKKWASWLVGKGKNEHVALDYKLVVQPVDDENMQEYVITSYLPRQNIFNYEREGLIVLDKTPYFADNKPLKEGNKSEAKLGVMIKNKERIKLIFSVIDLDLEKLIIEALPLFFISTNFGSRQSKGFGCFLPANISQKELENLLNMYFPVVFKSKQFNDLKDVFNGIDSIYKNLKSGDRNTESELRKYYNEFRPVIEWEKPAIQEKVSEISGMNLRIKSKTNNRQFARALLGLPEIFEYPKHGGIKAQVQFSGNDDSKKKKDQIVIERYSSPIFFKVFSNTIYLTAIENDYSKIMLNKPFDFEFSLQGRKYGKIEGMKTPQEFNLIEFLQRAMKNQQSWTKL